MTEKTSQMLNKKQFENHKKYFIEIFKNQRKVLVTITCPNNQTNDVCPEYEV